jgi:bifunctional DNA-binding transcriptional regulator/antitoxin component of YhaV-PrlF toxin-antitoxin module
MASKTTTGQERIGRVGQRRQVIIPREIFEKLRMRKGDFVAFSPKKDGVLVKPKRVADRDDVLTSEESTLVSKARQEMSEGKYVSLTQLEHDLAHKRPPRRRKTA